MAVTPFDSAFQRDLFSDRAVAALFADSAEIRAMLLFEGALARVQGRLGMIPETAAAAISRAAETVMIDPAGLAEGTAADGVVAPALVAAFRKAMEAPEHAAHVHWGATSQDVIDTGLVLRLRRVTEIFAERLAGLDAALAALARDEAETVMAARTRGQVATPTTFGARVAVWRAPLARCRARLAELSPRLLRVSLAGASGNLSAMGSQGPTVAAALAKELRLGHDPVPWHASRDAVAEFGGFCALVTGALGKIGADVMALAQSEIAEISVGGGGGSSTMPHKVNPVRAEALTTLARANAGLVGRCYEAMTHEAERDGAAWSLEFLTLPQMAVATGAALTHAAALIAALEARPEAMRATLDRQGGLPMAEAATFALARHMPRPEAQALVKAACRDVAAQGGDLRMALKAATDVPVDWDEVFDPAAQTGAAADIARGD